MLKGHSTASQTGAPKCRPALLFFLYCRLPIPTPPPALEYPQTQEQTWVRFGLFLLHIMTESRHRYTGNGCFQGTKGVRTPGPHLNVPLLDDLFMRGLAIAAGTKLLGSKLRTWLMESCENRADVSTTLRSKIRQHRKLMSLAVMGGMRGAGGRGCVCLCSQNGARQGSTWLQGA